MCRRADPPWQAIGPAIDLSWIHEDLAKCSGQVMHPAVTYVVMWGVIAVVPVQTAHQTLPGRHGCNPEHFLHPRKPIPANVPILGVHVDDLHCLGPDRSALDAVTEESNNWYATPEEGKRNSWRHYL